MTRDESINLLTTATAKLSDEQLADLAAMAQHMASANSVYETLTSEQKVALTRGLDELDRDEGTPHEEVMTRIGAKLAKHGV